MAKSKKSKTAYLDREEVSNLIDAVQNLDNIDLSLKKKILNYLSQIVKLSMDVEHSKISIAKLQKLFGFLSQRSNSKEALGIQNLVKTK